MTRSGKVELKRVIDPELASALSHPIRGHILVTIGEAGDVSPKEIALETELPVSEVSYHFRRLRRGGLIKEVRAVQRRGFAEHFYRLTGPVLYIDDPEWELIPEQIRSTINGELLRQMQEELLAALRAGTLAAEQSHMSHVPMLADEQARREILQVEKDALERKLEIKERCERRVKERCERRAGDSAERMIPLSVVSATYRRAP